MLYLPLGPVTVTNGPACFQNCPRPLSPQAQQEMEVAIYSYLLTGSAAVIVSLVARFRNSREPICYGWAMISLAAVHSLTSVLILELSMPPPSVGIGSFVVFIGPILALASGWILSTEKPAA